MSQPIPKMADNELALAIAQCVLLLVLDPEAQTRSMCGWIDRFGALLAERERRGTASGTA